MSGEEKHLIALPEVGHYDAQEPADLAKEVRDLEKIKSEVEARLKSAKRVLTEKVQYQHNGEFNDGTYEVTVKTVTQNRIDNNWVKRFIEEQGAEPKYKQTQFDKLNIKRID